MKFSMQSINDECQASKSLQKWRDREVKLQKKWKDYNSNKDLVIKRKSKDISGDN